jgi:hypothetical protein
VPQVIPAIPEDSKEIIVPSSDHVVSLTEDILSISENPPEMDWQSFPEEFYSHVLNEFSYYQTRGLAGQIFSERLASGCGGYQVGCLWTNTVSKDALEDEQVFGEYLHSKPQNLGNASLLLEQTPHELSLSEDGVWEWQSRAGQLVSMFYQHLLLCLYLLT